MRLSILILFFCVIGFVLVGGCISNTSKPTIVTPTMEQPPTPMVQVIATIVQSTMPVSNTDTLCGELVYCGYAPAGFQTQPIKSSRCDQLYTLRLQNDQKVMQCLKNPYEVSAGTARDQEACAQGMITDLEYCAKIGVTFDKNGNYRINISKMK